MNFLWIMCVWLYVFKVVWKFRELLRKFIFRWIVTRVVDFTIHRQFLIFVGKVFSKCKWCFESIGISFGSIWKCVQVKWIIFKRIVTRAVNFTIHWQILIFVGKMFLKCKRCFKTNEYVVLKSLDDVWEFLCVFQTVMNMNSDLLWFFRYSYFSPGNVVSRVYDLFDEF